MAIDDDSEIGRKLVERKLATAAEVSLCQARRKELSEKGKTASLCDILVEAGYTTRSQIARLEQLMDDDSMYRPAQQIPGFQIRRKLGQGAMAAVFEAKQISLDRIVAVKVLPKRFSENQEFVDRFYREGRAAARLNHPNIVQAIDVGEAGGYHYFVMEYVKGDTVYDQVSSGAPYAEGEALRIILQTAYALEHAHDRGFIHRDVKPKNIMIAKGGDVKLADLGLARDVSDRETAAAEAGRAYGTPYYISPEQIRGEVDIDFRADIYSLGATFYHMVTGRVPYEGSTPSAVMHKHLKEQLVPPDHVNTSLSAGIGEIIEVMMAKERDDRYHSTKDLIADLEAVVAGEPPYQAHKKYDDVLLQSLATTGETVSSGSAGDLDPSMAPPERSLAILVLIVALGVSLLLNVVLAILALGD